jgi:hemin uptake protein HemP
MKQENAESTSANLVALDLSRPIPAERLLADQDKVQIEYKGQIYMLRQTRNDKLILTK